MSCKESVDREQQEDHKDWHPFLVCPHRFLSCKFNRLIYVQKVSYQAGSFLKQSMRRVICLSFNSRLFLKKNFNKFQILESLVLCVIELDNLMHGI